MTRHASPSCSRFAPVALAHLVTRPSQCSSGLTPTVALMTAGEQIMGLQGNALGKGYIVDVCVAV